MTCFQASQAFRVATHNGIFPGQSGGASPAQWAASLTESRTGGDCLLPAGRAVTLRARQAGVLRIVQGRVWITFDHADRDGRVQAGDHFLGAGEALRLSAGDTVVMESWTGGGGSITCFKPEPASAVRAMPVA